MKPNQARNSRKNSDQPTGPSPSADNLAALARAAEGNSAAPARSTARARSRRATLAWPALLAFIALCGGVILGVYHLLTPDPPPSGAGGTMTGEATGRTAQPGGTAPFTYPSGGLFEMPFPTTAPVSASAPTGPSPEELDRQRAEAQVAYADALKAEAAGNLMAAQVILVNTLSAHDRRAWPDGAAEKLGDIQRRIRATTRRAEPAPDELARRRRSAEGLFARALAKEREGDILTAQTLLLKLLDEYRPDAWPAGAQDALRRIQKLLAAPSSGPGFLGTETPE